MEGDPRDKLKAKVCPVGNRMKLLLFRWIMKE
jgi:hypothetical protein